MIIREIQFKLKIDRTTYIGRLFEKWKIVKEKWVVVVIDIDKRDFLTSDINDLTIEDIKYTCLEFNVFGELINNFNKNG